MYSASSSSSDYDSSDDSHDRRRRRRPHRSKSLKTRPSLFEDSLSKTLSQPIVKHSMLFDNDSHKYSKESRKLHNIKLSAEKPKSHRKKHSSRDTSSRESYSTVSKEELKEMKRKHEKELKNLLKFLEKESVLLHGIEEEKREELHELKRKHEKEVRKVFQFQEEELATISEQYARERAELEEQLELIKNEARDEVRKYKERNLELEEDLRTATEDLQLTTQKATYEVKKINTELSSAVRQNSLLENEVKMLREKLAEKDTYIHELEGMNSKSSYVEEELRNEIRFRDDEIRRRDKAIMRKNEEIRSFNNSRPTTPIKIQHQQLDTININKGNQEWEETSGLTISSDFDHRRYHSEHKPPKYGYSPEQGRRMSNSSSKRLDSRDDSDVRRLTVSFSDDVVEKRVLPMQAHDNLSKRLEKLYLHR